MPSPDAIDPPPATTAPTVSRRDVLLGVTAAASALALGVDAPATAATTPAAPAAASRPATGPTTPTAPPSPHPFLTPPDDYYDVSRGSPKPHSLVGDALVRARLTPDTWRCEVVADAFTDGVVKEAASLAKPLTLAGGTALDLPALVALGDRRRVRFLKAMQCLNISSPLGQGVWEGVPLRDVLALAGPVRNVRRVYYWGFHNDDPKQVFRSSLSYTQVMETPPGDFPPFVAYRLNGEPIPLARGGPVRMIVPWAHGFKSIKWLQRVAVTNDFRANDTYANANNDPESYLKSAAYIDPSPERVAAGSTAFMSGLAIAGYSGLSRVEHWLHRVEPGSPPVAYDDAT
ncbi:MAG TPA: molybdopterin-dependent oxidoreductase, partial [Humisphaera sp.]